MQNLTFLGEIQGGRILTEQPLAELEGKKVSVTVLNPETAATVGTGSLNESPSPGPHSGPEEVAILEDLGRIQMPRREVTTIHLTMRDVGRRPIPVYSSDEED
jgi:hypothetical protein